MALWTVRKLHETLEDQMKFLNADRRHSASSQELDMSLLVQFFGDDQVWYECGEPNQWSASTFPLGSFEFNAMTTREQILRAGFPKGSYDTLGWTDIMFVQELLRQKVNDRQSGIAKHWAELEAAKNPISAPACEAEMRLFFAQ